MLINMFFELISLTTGSALYSAVQAGYPEHIVDPADIPESPISYRASFMGSFAFNTLSIYSIALGYYCAGGDPLYIEIATFGVLTLLPYIDLPNLNIPHILHTTSITAGRLGVISISGALAATVNNIINDTESASIRHDLCALQPSGPGF